MGLVDDYGSIHCQISCVHKAILCLGTEWVCCPIDVKQAEERTTTTTTTREKDEAAGLNCLQNGVRGSTRTFFMLV